MSFSTISTLSSFLHIRHDETLSGFKIVQNMFEGYTPSIGTTNVYPNDSTLSGTPYGVISFTNKGYTISASSCQRGGGLWNEYKANHPYLMFDNLNATM